MSTPELSGARVINPRMRKTGCDSALRTHGAAVDFARLRRASAGGCSMENDDDGTTARLPKPAAEPTNGGSAFVSIRDLIRLIA